MAKHGASRAALVVVVALVGCGEPEPARFVGLEIWEAQLAGSGPLVPVRLVAPEADGTFALRRDLYHVARVSFSTSGRADRCLFEPFFYNWDLPSHSFSCYPEAEGGATTLDLPFATWTSQVARVPDLYVSVQAYEHGPNRTLIGVHDRRRYAVRITD